MSPTTTKALTPALMTLASLLVLASGCANSCGLPPVEEARQTRRPTVAGMFYPAEGPAIDAEARRLLEAGSARASGFSFSGVRETSGGEEGPGDSPSPAGSETSPSDSPDMEGTAVPASSESSTDSADSVVGTSHRPAAGKASHAAKAGVSAHQDESIASVPMVLAPHAAWFFSGEVAGASIGRLAPSFRRVFVLAANHSDQLDFQGVSVDRSLRFRLPDGDFPIDQEAVAKLLAEEGFADIPDVHKSHIIEVQLPLLKAGKDRAAKSIHPAATSDSSATSTSSAPSDSSASSATSDSDSSDSAAASSSATSMTSSSATSATTSDSSISSETSATSTSSAPSDSSAASISPAPDPRGVGFTIVPLIVGRVSPDQAPRFAAQLHRVMKDGDAVLFSLDMSHYHPDPEARDLDARCLAALEDMDSEAIGRCVTDGTQMLLVMNHLAALMGLTPKVVDYGNSGEIPEGEKESVVGYGALVYEDRLALTGGERRALEGLARQAVESKVRTGKAMDVPEGLTLRFPRLKRELSAFVTLRTKEGGRLRGCIGSLLPGQPLVDEVAENAVKAALKDDRFPPVKAEELEGLSYSVSVLGPMRSVDLFHPGAWTEGMGDGEKYGPGLRMLDALHPGVFMRNGLSMSTFLPSVWSEIPDPVRFLEELCLKQGGELDCWMDRGASFKLYDAL